MSVRHFTMYAAACDWPGCGAVAPSVWHAAAEVCLDEAADWDGWRQGRDGTHYCGDHPSTWVSDHDDGKPYPDAPYLLIHDGDTDGRDDDGKVTYVGSAT